MAETREIRLDVTEDDVESLIKGLNRLRVRAEGLWIADLISQIRLAWTEAEFRDERDAHNDWVNREMYGKEVESDPDAVVRYVNGRDVVQLAG